jgi:hypothetical protein
MNGLSIVTRFQAIFGLKFENKLTQALHELCVNYAIKAENWGPGSFDDTLEKILSYKIDNLASTRNDLSIVKQSDFVTWPSFDEFRQYVKKRITYDEVGVDIALEAIDLAGFAGRIVIERTNNDVISIELMTGYTFDAVVHFAENVKLIKPSVICIDGFIESVSELHRLLTQSYENKTQIVLFCRGLSDDVLQTLRVNFDRRTAIVVPVVMKFDLQGINILNDIATVVGSRLISSNLGDLISNVTLADSTIVESLMLHHDQITITNSSTNKNVAIHANTLITKRDESTTDDLRSLLNTRIKALKPNQVIIRIPSDGRCVERTQAIDLTLRMFRATVDHGFIDGRPATTKHAPEIYSRSCIRSLNDLGAVILVQ